MTAYIYSLMLLSDVKCPSHVIIGLNLDLSDLRPVMLCIIGRRLSPLVLPFWQTFSPHTLIIGRSLVVLMCIIGSLARKRYALSDPLRNLALSDYLSFYTRIEHYRTLVRKLAINPDIIGLILSKSKPISCVKLLRECHQLQWHNPSIST